jgi:hypothetical protein
MTVSGNVTVGDGATLHVGQYGTLTVSDYVGVGNGATLDVGSPTHFTVGGLLFAMNPSLIRIDATPLSSFNPSATAASILGSMFVTGAAQLTALATVFIGDNLSIVNSKAGASLIANTVAGNVLFQYNFSTAQNANNAIANNAIAGSLVCTGNRPAPTSVNKTTWAAIK